MKLRRGIFISAYLAASAACQGHIGMLYAHLGFTGAQIGMIGTAAAGAAIASQLFWGHIADRRGHRARLLTILCAAAGGTVIAAQFPRAFAWQIVISAAFWLSFGALLPIGDSILLAADADHFGRYRIAGAVCFAASGAAVGALGAQSVVPVGAGCLAAAAVGARLLPDDAARSESRAPMRLLLRNRDLMRDLLLMIPAQMAAAYYYGFHSPYFLSLEGANRLLLGAAALIATAGEIPYLIFADRIYRRFGTVLPVLFSMLFMAARYAVLAASGSAVAAMLAAALYGGGLPVITCSMNRSIADHVRPGEVTSGQMLYGAVCTGAARMAGSWLIGSLADGIGMRGGFAVCAGLCAASAAAWGILKKSK